jgi:type II secretory pathway pseudopilin PulG
MTEENTPGSQPSEQEEPKRGAMRFQDESTTPREPTLAEQRARRKAIVEEQEREEAERQALEVAERKSATKRKILIGSGVTVGLVGLVSAWYIAATPNEVNAVCTDASGKVVGDDNYCDESYATSHGGYYNPGTGFMFIPIPGGGFNQYRYNYGGSGPVGSTVSGGSYTKPPSNAKVTTNSGKTVQRGGFGISGKSSSGTGGKSGGS